MTAAPETAVAVLTSVLTSAVINRTLVLICAVRASVEVITFATSADETSIRVFTEMVTRIAPTAFIDILAGAFVSVDLVSLGTDAFVGAVSVDTFVAASSKSLFTFVDVHAGLSIRVKDESSGTTADRSLWSIITTTITASVIHTTRRSAGLGVVT